MIYIIYDDNKIILYNLYNHFYENYNIYIIIIINSYNTLQYASTI